MASDDGKLFKFACLGTRAISEFIEVTREAKLDENASRQREEAKIGLGSLIHIPGVTPLVLRAFAHEPYDQGAFKVGPVQLYVNRGVGNSALRLRLNSAPEVTLAVLRRPEVA